MSFDYLPGTTIEIKQRKDMFRFNSDTHYLGEFLRVYKNEILLDIGCNNGALLLYASKQNPEKLMGVDCFQEAIDLAKENMNHNQVEGELICSKIQDVQIEKVDVIVCNPPFFKVGEQSLVNENEYLRVARHEESLTLSELFDQCKRLLKEDGRFYLVHRSHRLTEIIEQTLRCGFKVKKMKLVFDENKEFSTSCLFEICKGSNDQVLIEKPIVLVR